MLQRIQCWDHWKEVGRVAQKEYGVSEEDYQRLLPEYQKFLALIANYRVGMLSKDIDRLWHAHILRASP
ncbi:hypothetical protein EPA93_10180 [Ktedonosporobacter rubrisoli]|uniref:Uncharacterized protein n=1 Tax=Ktedonosporobacter rubrisoli TaxID=2509675 RepID=A0A4P6JM92_KTERU|nr:hypothetical protein [Ktedonosporobacter rubrisoli]QBD76355.1 hypothetical protein EPA93_10180 [Ktedonosporobacter rubrisoli]